MARTKKTKPTTKTPVGRWKKLNWELYRVSEDIVSCMEQLAADRPRDMFVGISRGFITKSTQTLKAVNILYDSRLEEQAQALVRVLFELRLNFDCFLKMTQDDMKSACRRVVDSMLLEKLKQVRDPTFVVPPIVPLDPNSVEDMAKEIASRYSPDELRSLTRYGFTGLTIEGRARLTGHKEAYNVVYRNFSRNVHSTDYLEHSLHLIGEDIEEYLESRDITGLYTAHFSAGGIAEFANAVFRCGQEKELNEIGEKQKRIRSTSEV